MRTDTAGEIAEMVDGERNIGGQCFAYRLAIIPGFGFGNGLQVFFNTVGDTVQDQRPLCRAGHAPGILGGVRGIQRQFHIGGI